MSVEEEFKDDLDLGSAIPEEEDEGLEPIFELDDVGISEVSQAVGHLWGGYITGDDEMRIKVNDAGRRWKRFKEERPESNIWFWRAFLPFLLVIYSLFIMIRLAIRPTMRGLVAAPSFLGDIIFMNIVFVAFPVLGYFVLSEIVGEEVTEGFFSGAMLLSKVFQIFVISIIVMMYGLLFGGEGILEWLSIANSYYTSVPGLPAFSVAELSSSMVMFGALITFPYGSRYIRARSAMIIAEKSEVPDPDVDEETDLKELITWVGREDSVSHEFSMSYDELLNVPDSLRKEFGNGYVEVERYWLRLPYSYACISYNDSNSDYRYHTVEPKIETEEEKAILEQYQDNLSTALLREDISEREDITLSERQNQKSKKLERLLREISTRYDVQPDRKTYQKVLYLIERNQVYYGKIDPLMNDPNIEDISCDGDNIPIFIFHKEYKDLMTDIRFNRSNLRSFVIQLAQRSGEHISVSDPLVKASLPDGSRAQITLGNEITDRGSTFTIRLFEDIPFTPIDLIRAGTFTKRQMAYIWLAIENNKSLIFAGSTASGKTTSLNAISLFIPPKSKVISIEDTREISLPHQNWIPKKTRDKFGKEGNEIDMQKLLQSALRQRPEYLVVGEIRGEEAQALFQAIETGHTTYATMHTDTVEGAFQRLQNPPINVPKESVASLDIISIQAQVRRTNEKGETKNLRRNIKMSEINSEKVEEDGEIQLRVEQDPMFVRNDQGLIKESGLEESTVLEDIRRNKAWSREELTRNLEERVEVLEYLLENDIEDVVKITKTIQVYSLNREKTIQKIRDGTFDPDDVGDLTDTEFGIKELPEKEVKQLEGDIND